MPTNRGAKPPKRTAFDKVDREFAVMTKVNNREFVVKVDQIAGREETQVALNIYPGSGFSLSQYTEAELDAIEETFRLAFALARPSCIEADRLAKESYETGGSDFRRLYRSRPVVAARQRLLAEHGEGVRGGLEGVVDLDARRRGREADDVEGDGGDGGAVPQRTPS